jgi:hypothetical protein
MTAFAIAHNLQAGYFLFLEQRVSEVASLVGRRQKNIDRINHKKGHHTLLTADV